MTDEKRKRGFAAMDKEKVREFAARGGVAAHKKGVAHQFTTEEARIAGKKGGLARHKARGRTIVNESIEVNENAEN